jgi:methyl-accepting chemotaxis protein
LVRTDTSLMSDATAAAVAASDQGTKVVDQGLTLTGRAGEGIRSLADTIREASAAAEQIAASAHQQSVGIDQIAQAMSNIDDGTAQFLEGAHQSQRVAGDLNDLSGKLAALTARYRV